MILHYINIPHLSLQSQYIFVHDALLEYIKYGDSNIPLKEFPKHVESLLKVNPDKKKTGLQEEFQVS